MEVNLISTFAEFKELKNIDRPTMMSVLEDIFRTQLIKMYGSADNFDIIINIDKGDLEIKSKIPTPRYRLRKSTRSIPHTRWERISRKRSSCRISAAGVSSTCARTFRDVSPTSRKPISTTNTRTVYMRYW